MPAPTPAISQTPSGPKVVVIGGGTGSFAVLSGLKAYARDITAIVNMSDNGGSTGALRDELGALPPGDIRQCLVALSEDDGFMRELFNYRFEAGALVGHSFGNLFLTALEKTTGSFAEAVRTAGHILAITGQVVPVTLTDTHLVLTEPAGQVTRGEFAIGSHTFAPTTAQFSLDPAAKLNPQAEAAITAADLIVIAPGNLYTSLVPTLIVPGLAAALAASPARRVYITNLVTKTGQTDNFKAHNFAREIERFIAPAQLDYVIYNTNQPKSALLDKYAQAGEYAVGHDLATLKTAHYQAIGADLVSDTMPQLKAAEQHIPRTFIRHDPHKLARVIMKIYFS
jgi:uncharacterized cofD-like protein